MPRWPQCLRRGGHKASGDNTPSCSSSGAAEANHNNQKHTWHIWASAMLNEESYIPGCTHHEVVKFHACTCILTGLHCKL